MHVFTPPAQAGEDTGLRRTQANTELILTQANAGLTAANAALASENAGYKAGADAAVEVEHAAESRLQVLADEHKKREAQLKARERRCEQKHEGAARVQEAAAGSLFRMRELRTTVADLESKIAEHKARTSTLEHDCAKAAAWVAKLEKRPSQAAQKAKLQEVAEKYKAQIAAAQRMAAEGFEHERSILNQPVAPSDPDGISGIELEYHEASLKSLATGASPQAIKAIQLFTVQYLRAVCPALDDSLVPDFNDRLLHPASMRRLRTDAAEYGSVLSGRDLARACELLSLQMDETEINGHSIQSMIITVLRKGEVRYTRQKYDYVLLYQRIIQELEC